MYLINLLKLHIVDFLKGLDELQPDLLRVSLNDPAGFLNAVYDCNFWLNFHLLVDTPSRFFHQVQRCMDQLPNQKMQLPQPPLQQINNHPLDSSNVKYTTMELFQQAIKAV
jgi:hypothetical protein